MRIDDILRETQEDERFSRAEKRDLKAWLHNQPVNDDKLAHFRTRAFAMAREAGNEPWVISWLERVIRVLSTHSVVKPAEAFFSPGDACRDEIRERLGASRQTVDICVFTITDNNISDTILRTHARGVKVRIITDNDKAEDLGADIDRLHAAGIPVVVDHTRHHMHHKFAIFDSKYLLTGSYNWTRSAASSNQENIIVTMEHGVIRQYQREFDRLWKSLG